jgi:hypothetical protein
MRLARQAGRSSDVGFMIHSSDHWGAIADFMTPGAVVWDDIEEKLHWDMIHKYRPPILSFYSVLAALVPGRPWYDKTMADLFWKRLQEYKQSFSI